MNELEKIECMFASAMFDVYTQRRFGLKSCRPRIDESTLYDILKLYLNSLSIAECGLCPTCDIQTLNEKINTL